MNFIFPSVGSGMGAWYRKIARDTTGNVRSALTGGSGTAEVPKCQYGVTIPCKTCQPKRHKRRMDSGY